MNQIKAKVSKIDSIDNINLVCFKVGDKELKMIALELDPFIVLGANVLLGVKGSSIILSKELNIQLSASNLISCVVKEVNNGKLLCWVDLIFQNITIQSLITKDSSILMDLKKDDQVLAIIKASELFIMGFDGV